MLYPYLWATLSLNSLSLVRRKHAELVGEISILYRKEEKLLSEVCLALVDYLFCSNSSYLLLSHGTREDVR